MTDAEFIRRTLLVAEAIARTHKYQEHTGDCARSIEMIGALAEWKRERENEARSESRAFSSAMATSLSASPFFGTFNLTAPCRRLLRNAPTSAMSGMAQGRKISRGTWRRSP